MKKLQIMRYLILVLMLQVFLFAQNAVEFTGYKGNVNTVAFSPDSKTLLSGDEKGNLFLWELSTSQKIHSLGTSENITSVNYSPADKDMAVYTSYGGDVTIIKASNREILKTFTKNGNIYYAEFSPDGKQLAVAYTREPTEKEETKGIRLNFIVDLHETAKFEKTKTLRLSKPHDPDGELFGSNFFETYRYNSFSCAFSSNSAYLASGSMGKNIAIYSFDLKTFAPTYKGHSSRVMFVSFSPDGNYLASASKDETAKLWNVTSGGSIVTLKGHTGNVNSLAFSPDSKYLATASNDETIKIWDVKTAALLKTLSIPGGEMITVKFSPDGKYLAAGGSNEKVLVWEVSELLQ
jgi:WD40 repeat protein